MNEEVEVKLKTLSSEFQGRVESNQRMIMGILSNSIKELKFVLFYQ